jgi:SAM-dependent methyltransferase
MHAQFEWCFERQHTCPLCSHEEAKTIFERTIRSLPLRFVKCSQCSLIRQDPRLSAESLQHYFSSSYFIQDSKANNSDVDNLLGYPDYFSWDPSYKKTARFRLQRIIGNKPPPATLLEIGTATGSFLAEARQAGYSVRGLDVSAAFAEMAKKNYHLDIDVAFVETFPLPEAHYDIICNFGGISCWREPMKALMNIRQSLKPDGIFVFNHSDADSLLARLRGNRYFEFNHASLSLFTSQSIRLLLQTAGFRIELTQTERQYASFSRIVTYLKLPPLIKLFKILHMNRWTIPVLAFGTKFCICRPMGCADMAPRPTQAAA